MIPSVITLLTWAFNAAVELEPSIAKLIDALDLQLKADEAEADNLPPLPDPPPTAPSR